VSHLHRCSFSFRHGRVSHSIKAYTGLFTLLTDILLPPAPLPLDTLCYPARTSPLTMILVRELCGLGLLHLQGQARKRRNLSEGNRQKKAKIVYQEAMKQEFDPFQDFRTKVDQILRCPDKKALVSAFRNLAEGEQVVVSKMTISRLAGLGEQQPDEQDRPNTNYRQAMTGILEWGLRAFPVDPEESGIELWLIMATLDGSAGYNQG
jgi:hypothetical protein